MNKNKKIQKNITQEKLLYKALNLGLFVGVFLFFVYVYFPESTSEYFSYSFIVLAIIVGVGSIFLKKIFQWGVFVLLVFLGVHQMYEKLPSTYNYIHQYATVSATYEEKMSAAQGWPMFYFSSVKDVVEEDASYMFPPQATWPTMGNQAIMRYFLVPRKSIRENHNWVREQEDLDYVLRLNAVRSINPLWPLFYVPVKNYYRSVNLKQHTKIFRLILNDTPITDLQEYELTGDVLSQEVKNNNGEIDILLQHGRKISNNYFAQVVNIPVEENTVVTLDLIANCQNCTSSYVEITFNNNDKVVFDSMVNRIKYDKNNPSQIERIIFNDIFTRVYEYAKNKSISAEGAIVSRVGVNVGRVIPYKLGEIGVIEVEHGKYNNVNFEKENFSDAKMYFAKGYKEKYEGNFDKAAAYFKQATLLQSDYVDPYIEMAYIYSDKKNYNAAIEWLEGAAKIDPDYHWIYYELGNIYREVGQLETALEQYKKAANIVHPQYEESVNDFLSNVIQNNSNSLIGLPKYDGFISLAIGETYEALGNIEEARKYYTFVAWNIWFAYDSSIAWDHLRRIGPDILKIMPIP